LIENALKIAGRVPDAKYTTNQLALTLAKRDAIVYKMHGDQENPDDAVLTKDDYEKYHITHGAFISALSGDLISKTFLFLGFSFTDPNLDYILSRIRINFKDNQRKHYCIFKKRNRLEKESQEEHDYAVLRQDFHVKDLKRFNIHTLLVDDYAEITTILQAIENRHRQKTVLVSGSAHEYGPFPEPRKFMQDLSQALNKNEYKIVSGFGLGVGSYVITGALEQIYANGGTLQEQLILRPFPQGEDARKDWEAYRQDMVARAGIAIFIFGNKLESNVVISANGVRREFEIANEKGLKVIPVGATGFMAKELWQEVIERFDSYYPGNNADLKPLFMSLGDASKPPNEHVSTILNILSRLKRS